MPHLQLVPIPQPRFREAAPFSFYSLSHLVEGLRRAALRVEGEALVLM